MDMPDENKELTRLEVFTVSELTTFDGDVIFYEWRCERCDTGNLTETERNAIRAGRNHYRKVH
jgi:hypothetical protein